jgi:hypothetical protein
VRRTGHEMGIWTTLYMNELALWFTGAGWMFMVGDGTEARDLGNHVMTSSTPRDPNTAPIKPSRRPQSDFVK